MKGPLLIAIALVGAACLSNPTDENDTLARKVGDAILERFGQIDGVNFGMDRCGIPEKVEHVGPSPRREMDPRYIFRVLNSADRRLVTGVKKRNKQIVFYTVSLGATEQRINPYRRYSPPRPPYDPAHPFDSTSWQGIPHMRMRGPAVLFKGGSAGPKPEELLPIVKQVRIDPAKRDHFTKIDGWILYARPVMATKEACVSCHNEMAQGAGAKPTFKLNKPIGMLLLGVKDRIQRY